MNTVSDERTEPLLPMNLEAEISVLDCLVIDPACVGQVITPLRPDDFYRFAHQQVYAAVIDLWKAHTPADSVTLVDELRRQDQPEDVDVAVDHGHHLPTAAKLDY